MSERKLSRRYFLGGAASLAALLLAGEHGRAQLGRGRPLTLHFSTLFHGGDAQAMTRIVEKFNKEHRDVQIDLIQGQWEDYYAQLYLAAIAGNAPQLGICHTTRLPAMAVALTPLDESPWGNLLEAAGIQGSDYAPALWEAGELEGRRYLIPLDTHMWGMWYNREIFRRAGLDPDRPPETLSELEAACEAIRKTGKYALHPADLGRPRMIRRAWFILYWQMGGELLSEDGKRAAFNNDKGVAALRYLVDMVQSRRWNKPGTDGVAQFTAGELGMLWTGNWFYWTAEKSGVDYGFHYMPRLFERRVTWGDSHNLVIPRQPAGTPKEMILAAIRAIRWMSANSDIWGIYGGHIPAYLPAQKSTSLQESKTWQVCLRKFAEMVQRGELHYDIVHPKGPEINSAIEAPLQEAYNGTLEVKEALRRAERDVNRVLAS